MSKSTNNYIDYLSKEKINNNYPKTPCIKTNCNKNERIRFNNSKSRTGSMNKNKTGNINSKKKIKINSNLILDQEPDNYKKNNNIHKNFYTKNILNINNACNSENNNKNSYYYNNISEYNFYNKKINYILKFVIYSIQNYFLTQLKK